MILKADKGYRYTNGISYGRMVEIPETANSADWWQITEEEYQEIKKREQEVND